MVYGLNNKMCVLQRRAYGYRAEDYLKLKIIASFLPPLPKHADNDPHSYAKTQTFKAYPLRSRKVEAIKVHDLVPGRYKVMDKHLLRVRTSIDFSQGPELGV